MGPTFTFAGVSSATNGLVVKKMPPVQLAEARGEAIEVEGRDGYLYQDYASLAPLEKPIQVTLTDLTKINTIKAWLRGEGNLILSTEPDVFYKARVVGRLDLERWQLLRAGTIQFLCQPHGYLSSGLTPVTKTTKPTTITNPGTAPSKPVIKVTGSGDVTLTINAKNVILTGISGYVTVDSELEECYKDLVGKNNNMTGEWPELVVGSNAISWTGTVTSVEITPNWRNL